jgi:methyl-accepting chemotaxis protein
MLWFQAIAPIRLKLLLAFGLLTLLNLASGIAGFMVSAGHPAVAVVTVGSVLFSIVAGIKFRSMIGNPYVTTVVRMEALAAGDLESPIQFTDYQDCVGRLARAMFIFRDAALDKQRDAQVQTEVVTTLAAQLSQVAVGDLTATVTADFPATYADLKTNYNDALSSLRDLIGSVGETASAIRTGSSEIAQASEDLARRTESNAASLEETSAALSQIDERLKSTATASTSTVTRADRAIATVGGGRQVAEEAVQAMERVSDSAKGIDSVIEGLDKIAFQTRVLAMNAAVEAGRAGDAGRGFAVVADLVSALAMRAEEEAKRARDQLTVTQTDIVAAVSAVEKVDSALQNIAGDVDEVHTLLATMASDNMAQASAISQISAAVAAMDHSTQQNAAMVEETSAAAQNLTKEVHGLNDQTRKFKVDDGAVRPDRPAPKHFVPAATERGKSSRTDGQARRLSAATKQRQNVDDWTSF